MILSHTSFAFALIAHRGRLRITQEQMATALGVHVNTLRKWEQGAGPIVLTMEGAIERMRKMKAK